MEASPQEAAQETPKPTMLVVDDVPAMIRIAERMYSGAFNILKATNGKEALAVLKEHPDIEVIYTDQNMPGLTGTEWLKLSGIKPGSKKVLLHSGKISVEAEAARDLFETGISFISGKPPSDEETRLTKEFFAEKNLSKAKAIGIEITRMRMEPILGKEQFETSLQKHKVALITSEPIALGESLLASTSPESDKGQAISMILKLIKLGGSLIASTSPKNSLRTEEIVNLISTPISYLGMVETDTLKDFSKLFEVLEKKESQFNELKANPTFAGGHEMHSHCDRILALENRVQQIIENSGSNENRMAEGKTILAGLQNSKAKADHIRSHATVIAVNELQKDLDTFAERVKALEQNPDSAGVHDTIDRRLLAEERILFLQVRTTRVKKFDTLAILATLENRLKEPNTDAEAILKEIEPIEAIIAKLETPAS